MKVFKVISAAALVLAFANYAGIASARYIQSDPIGLAGGINTYNYALSNPLIWFDPDGLTPEQRFKTVNDAAMDAINYVRTTKQPQFVEWGGWIYKVANGCFTYDEPTKGTPGGVTLPRPVPSGVSGQYHTHPIRDIFNDNDESFSDRDIQLAKLYSPGFLGTPRGKMKRVNKSGGISETPSRTPKLCECPQ